MPIRSAISAWHSHVVGDVQNGQPQLLADIGQLLQDHPLHVDIQGGGRLVGNQQVGFER